MIPPHCLGPDVDRAKIAPDARIEGASYLTGRRTQVGPGAVVRDSRVHAAVIEAGASLVDSLFLAEGTPASHRCDAAGRTVVAGVALPRLGRGAQVEGSTLINTAVGARSRLGDVWARDCTLGEDNTVTAAKLTLVGSQRRVTIAGPTEVSEAWLGHGTTIDQCGYFEGIFSNRFLQLAYDQSARRLRVSGAIELPHTSRYGAGVIHSTNSGKLLPQPEGVLWGLGPYGGLWHDPLLSHEQIELGPCCWVVPWTKVVGQSPAAHPTDDDLVNDSLSTYLMPFSVAGWGGSLTRGLVMPGELSVGLGPKQRRGAWTFTYAPGAVIAMVARLHAALEDERKPLADTIVHAALDSALAVTRAMADRHEVDLTVAPDRQPKGGWPGWLARTFALLVAHRESELWRFEDGRPVGWRKEGDRWVHPALEPLLPLAPDAIANQVDEAALMQPEVPAVAASVALPSGSLHGSGGPPQIDPGASVSPEAHVGPGCRIGPETTIEAGVVLWNSVISQSHVGRGACVQRSVLSHAVVGPATTVRASRIAESHVGARSMVDAAALDRCHLAERATASPFADLIEVSTTHGTILGGQADHARIETHLMTMHMAGSASHLVALPTPVQLGGRTILVPAVPMLGAGVRVEGTAEAPVQMQCCFVGSNTILRPGVRVGFGCFLLGRIDEGTTLLPFTLTGGVGPEGHQIGGVLASLPSTILTHFLGWTFQAVGPELADAVAALVEQSIRRGQEEAVAELARRDAGAPPELPYYTDAQLRAGLAHYQRALASEAWQLVFRDGQLRFASAAGRWIERDGSAFWQVEKSRG